MSVEFEHPGLLYLLLLLPIWAVLLARLLVGRGVLFVRGESVGSIRDYWVARSGVLLWLPGFLRALTMGCVIIALAGPQRIGVFQERSLEGKGIVLAVDLSTSMLAEDMGGETRLSVARQAAVRFAERRQLDELALVGFGGQALTRVPPTSDTNLIVAGVESLGVELVRNGTDISGAVLASLQRLRESERQTGVVVLLTDGAHNAAGVPPLTTARAAANMGVRIHSISMAPSSAGVLVGGAATQQPGGLGGTETVLTAVAGLTGGQYFRAENASALDSIYREIDRIEAPVERLIERETRQPQRVWFLAVALLLIGLSGAVGGSRWGVVP